MWAVRVVLALQLHYLRRQAPVDAVAALNLDVPGLPAAALVTTNGTGGAPFAALPRLGSAWYINLDAFHGRRAEMEQAYGKAAMRYTRFPATRPTQKSLLPHGMWHPLWAQFHASRRHEIYDPVLSAKIRGELGCIVSHLQLLKHLQQTGRPGEVYLLAEDDYAPLPDFLERLPTALAALPHDWDSVRFDCWQSAGESLATMPEVRPGVFWMASPGCTVGQEQPGGRPKCHFCGGTHAILLPYEKVTKFLELWSGEKGPLFPVDCMMTRPDFKNFCLQWGLYRKVTLSEDPDEDLTDPSQTSIPKRAEDVTAWHVS